MFLSEFFMPVTVVACLVTFGKYLSVNWFGIFMSTTVGAELLLFATTGGVKTTQKAEIPKVSAPINPELIAARQRKAEESQPAPKEEEVKKSAGNTKQEKKAAAAAAKKNK